MKRKIKFRAWDEDSSQMHYPDSIDTNTGIQFCHYHGEASRKADPHPVLLHLTADDLMQYTGLQDKNGKDIYQGDIITVRNEGAYAIVWSEEFGCWHISQGDGHWMIYEENKSAVIIGNIYENPELVDGGR